MGEPQLFITVHNFSSSKHFQPRNPCSMKHIPEIKPAEHRLNVTCWVLGLWIPDRQRHKRWVPGNLFFLEKTLNGFWGTAYKTPTDVKPATRQLCLSETMRFWSFRGYFRLSAMDNKLHVYNELARLIQEQLHVTLAFLMHISFSLTTGIIPKNVPPFARCHLGQVNHWQRQKPCHPA